MKNGALSRAIFLIVASVMGAVTFSGSAHATTLADLTTDQLVDSSDAIVRGKIVEIWTEQANDGSVWTRAQVEVSQTYKGDASRTAYVIDQAGGTWGSSRTIVHGAARFSQGEEVVLFLENLKSGKIVPVGMTQGKFTLRLDPNSRTMLAQRFTPAPTQAYDHRFIPLPKLESRQYLADLEDTIIRRVQAGWDGVAIPGTSLQRLERINRTHAPVEVK